MPQGASIDVVMAYLHERIDAIYRGEPFGIDADIAFSAIAHEFGIPKAIPLALLEGFQWDAEGRRYETIDELYHYAARVAGTVGAMMTLVMGGAHRRPLLGPVNWVWRCSSRISCAISVKTRVVDGSICLCSGYEKRALTRRRFLHLLILITVLLA